MPNSLKRFVISLLSKKNHREAKPEEVMIDKATGEILVKTTDPAGTVVSYDYISRTNSGISDFIDICKNQGVKTGTVHKIELKDQVLYPVEVEANTNLITLFVKDNSNKIIFKNESDNALENCRLYIDASIIRNSVNDYFSTEPRIEFTLVYDGLTITDTVNLSVFNRTDFRNFIGHHIASQTNIVNKSAYDMTKKVEITSLKLKLQPEQTNTNKYKIIVHNIFTVK